MSEVDDRSSGDVRDYYRDAARQLARETGMSVEQATESRAFHDAAQGALNDVEQAVGSELAGTRFDWTDQGVRLKILVASAANPPSASNVGAAKRVLAAHGLLERSDFVQVKWSAEQLQRASERAWEVLEPVARVTHILLGVNVAGNSLAIRTADDLTEEQLEVVAAAVRAAGVPVRMGEPVGPGPNLGIPRTPMQWSLSTVGRDLRSLVVRISGGIEVRGAVLSVREREDEICIQVAVAELDGDVIPAVAASREHIVTLAAPVGGRRITVPSDSPPWRGIQHITRPPQLSERNAWRFHQLTPRVLGLHPEDADQLLRDQELGARHVGQGTEIIAQLPDPDTPSEPGDELELTVGTVARPTTLFGASSEASSSDGL
jgi:hypothetical protein